METEGLCFDVAATSSFFNDIDSAFDTYKTNGDFVDTSLNNFASSEDFRGHDADTAKKLTGVFEKDLLTELIELQTTFNTLCSDLLELFGTKVDSGSDARISETDLNAINKSFKGYYTSYHNLVESADKRQSDVIDKYSKYGKFNKNDFSCAESNYTDICGGDNDTEGFFYQCTSKLKSFDTAALELISKAEIDSKAVAVASKMQLYRSTGNDYDSIAAKQVLDICEKLVEGSGKTEYDKMLEQAILGQKPFSIVTMGDPINMSTGNFIYEHEDLTIQGEIPLSFHRYYNSLDDRAGSLGVCFRHNYEFSLERDKDLVRISLCDGETHNFRRVDDAFIPMGNAVEGLEKTADGYLFSTVDNKHIYFDKDGLMLRMENLNGRGITYTYNEQERLIQAINDNGDYLDYKYDFDGRLIVVDDSCGRRVCIYYVDGFIAKVKLAEGTILQYDYSENGGITTLVNSKNIDAVVNKYDEKNRVIEQSFADGGIITLEYDDEEKTVEMVEQNGVKTTCYHDELGRNTKTSFFDGTTEEFVYNTQNRCVAKKDRNGNVSRYAYDNRGNLTQIIAPDGRKTNYTYDSNGNVISVSINGKNQVKNTYDSKGNLLKTVNSLNEEVALSYDEAGRITKLMQPEGGVLSIEYDKKGNISAVTDGENSKTVYSYDELNRVIKTVDGNGNETTYGYDLRNNLVEVTNPLGYKRLYEYETNGQLSKLTDYDGYAVEYKYNEVGKVEKYIDKLGFEIAYTYDKMRNVSTVTNPDGGVTSFEYDENNRLRSKTNPLNGTQYFDYDAVGNLVGERTSEGEEIRNIFDSCNRLIETMYGENHSTKYIYDSQGNLTKVIDGKGQTTEYEYDALGRKSAEIDAHGARTEFTYNGLGKQKAIVGPNGSEMTFEYDKNGRVTKVVNPDQSKELFEYDKNGNVIKKTNGVGDTVLVDYDELNRIKRVTNQLGGTRHYTYDAVGNITEIIDENEGVTRYEYDKNSRLIRVEDALFNVTCYEYDSMGELIKSVQYGDNNQEPQITSYKRNLGGNITEIINPLGELESFKYNTFGVLIEKCDRDGIVTKYSYDNTGVLNQIDFADGRNIKLSYDALHQLSELQDWNGKTTISVDELGRPLSVTDSRGKTTSYEWGEAGERRSVIYPDGEIASYCYNEKLQLTSLSANGKSINYKYDNEGRVVQKTTDDGVETSYGYSPIGLVSQIRHTGNNISESISFTFDKAGNKLSAMKQRSDVPEDSGSFGYTYDLLNRLTSVTKDGLVLNSYKYDAFGNRIAKNNCTYEYNQANQLIKETEGSNTKDYSYDRRGNLVGVSQNGNPEKLFGYDVVNSLVSAADLSNGITASYGYNGFGQRIASTVKKVDKPIASIEYTVDYTRPYHNLLASTDSLNNTHDDFFYDGNVAIMKSKAMEELEDFYFLQDDLGSPMSVVNTRGAVQSYAYDEFGNNIIHAENIFESRQPFGYTGYQMDCGGMYFAQARRYDPSVGRFISEDFFKGIITAPNSLNRYAYCWNNPLAFVDTDGMLPKWAKTAIKVTAFVAITAAVVVAAPVVATAAAAAIGTVVASSTVAAGIATVVTAGAAGAVIAGGTEAVNELVDDGKVNVKKVGVAAGSGFVKGAAGATLALVAPAGAAGAVVTKCGQLAINAGVDVGKGYLNHKIDKVPYTKGDIITDVAVSGVSTVMGWGFTAIGNGINKAGNYYIDRHNMSSKTEHILRSVFGGSLGNKGLYEAYKNTIREGWLYTVSEQEFYHYEMEDAIQRYIVESALNNDKSLVRNGLLKLMKIAPKDLVRYMQNAYANVDCRYACG